MSESACSPFCFILHYLLFIKFISAFYHLHMHDRTVAVAHRLLQYLKKNENRYRKKIPIIPIYRYFFSIVFCLILCKICLILCKIFCFQIMPNSHDITKPGNKRPVTVIDQHKYAICSVLTGTNLIVSVSLSGAHFSG
jgi:hypothetical protein